MSNREIISCIPFTSFSVGGVLSVYRDRIVSCFSCFSCFSFTTTTRENKEMLSSRYTAQKSGGGVTRISLVIQGANLWDKLFLQASVFVVLSFCRLIENNIKKVSSPSAMGIFLCERKQQLCVQNTEFFTF